jgi:WhiB family redox-sensing transcriptional regulator
MTARQLRRGAAPWGRGGASPLDALAAEIAELKWQDDAACGEVGGDGWFPVFGESQRYAKRICRGCPVTAECLEYALTNAIEWGIWGGLSTKERQEIQRHREEAAA